MLRKVRGFCQSRHHRHEIKIDRELHGQRVRYRAAEHRLAAHRRQQRPHLRDGGGIAGQHRDEFRPPRRARASRRPAPRHRRRRGADVGVQRARIVRRTVPICTTMCPATLRAKAGVARPRTASIAVPSASIRIAMRARRKKSVASVATCAPATRRASALSAERFQTTRPGCARRRFRAMAWPMTPSPAKPRDESASIATER